MICNGELRFSFHLSDFVLGSFLSLISLGVSNSFLHATATYKWDMYLNQKLHFGRQLTVQLLSIWHHSKGGECLAVNQHFFRRRNMWQITTQKQLQKHIFFPEIIHNNIQNWLKTFMTWMWDLCGYNYGLNRPVAHWFALDMYWIHHLGTRQFMKWIF